MHITKEGAQLPQRNCTALRIIWEIVLSQSHTRTVVRECCNDDDQCQWQRPKFDPPPPLNLLTDRHQNLPTWLCRGCLPSCKISSRSDKGFCLCACAISRIKLFTRLFVRFLRGFFKSSRQPRRPHGFWRKIRQKTRFHAMMCLLGVAKPKVKLYTPFCPQNRHFGDLEIFARKRL